ncbi:ycgA, partial [mine drainage metagenome]
MVVTLAETTPVAEATRLVDDLARAGITPYGWVVNNTLDPSGTTDPVLVARAGLQGPQVDRVRLLAERVWTLGWQ